MITIRINKKPYKIPSSWYEVTYNQYCEILKINDDLLKLIGCFTGIPLKDLQKYEIKGLEDVIQCLSYLNNTPEFDGYSEKLGPFPLPVNHKGKFDIRFESLAQFEDMRKIMKAIPTGKLEDLIEAYPKFCAIYAQKLRDKEYDYNKAMDMVEEVKTYPLPDVMICGAFFFLKLLSLSNGTATTSHPKKSVKKVAFRSRQGGRNSSKSSGNTRRSTRSRGK